MGGGRSTSNNTTQGALRLELAQQQTRLMHLEHENEVLKGRIGGVEGEMISLRKEMESKLGQFTAEKLSEIFSKLEKQDDISDESEEEDDKADEGGEKTLSKRLCDHQKIKVWISPLPTQRSTP